ncbi:hypothetical protein CK203_043993 [Vitis vinifera]|uniref:Endonuclease/exonuclease/phosphatase domain-containing protein n=1 Tax=Vitis vinifera TaxID=29760 RepID=A0A438HTF4_VITVI|nr:hypothetical protein CK203_043993 [Vitis vinifera]
MVALDPPSPFFSPFGRTPLRESFDRSGALVDSTKGDRLCNGTGSTEQPDLCLKKKVDGWKRDGRKVIWLGGEEEKVYCARKRVPNYGSPMKIRLLSWNMCGVNDSSKRKVIKAMIRSQKVDLFCVQETKIQSMTEGLVRSLGSGRFLDWGALDAQGAAGGILIC